MSAGDPYNFCVRGDVIDNTGARNSSESNFL